MQACCNSVAGTALYCFAWRNYHPAQNQRVKIRMTRQTRWRAASEGCVCVPANDRHAQTRLREHATSTREYTSTAMQRPASCGPQRGLQPQPARASVTRRTAAAVFAFSTCSVQHQLPPPSPGTQHRLLHRCAPWSTCLPRRACLARCCAALHSNVPPWWWLPGEGRRHWACRILQAGTWLYQGRVLCAWRSRRWHWQLHQKAATTGPRRRCPFGWGAQRPLANGAG